MLDDPLVRWFYHFLCTISTLLSTFWMWIILRHSPKEMRDFKWLLVKLALMEELFAILIGLILVVDPLFPAPAGAVLGLAAYFGELGARLAMGLGFFFGMSIFFSINNCVRIRAMLINGREDIVRSCAKPYIGIPITMGFKLVMACPMLVSMYFALEDPNMFLERMRLTDDYQYIASYAQRSDTVWLCMDPSSTWGMIFTLVVLIGLTGMYVVNVVASLNLFRGLRSHQSLMSKGAYKSHLAIFYMLLSQNIYPIFVMILPVILTGISFTINEHTLLASNVYKHYIYIGLVIYPAMSCIISIMIMKPYRTYVKRHIFGIKDLPGTLEPTLSITGARLTRSSLTPKVRPVMNHRSTNRSLSTM